MPSSSSSFDGGGAIGGGNNRLQSALLVGGGAGAGATALAAWAAAGASDRGDVTYCRFVTVLDLLAANSGGGAVSRFCLCFWFCSARLSVC